MCASVSVGVSVVVAVVVAVVVHDDIKSGTARGKERDCLVFLIG